MPGATEYEKFDKSKVVEIDSEPFFENSKRSKSEEEKHAERIEREWARNERAQRKKEIADIKKEKPGFFERHPFLEKIKNLAVRIKDGFLNTMDSIGVRLMGGKAAYQKVIEAETNKLINEDKPKTYNLGTKVVTYNKEEQGYIEGLIMSNKNNELEVQWGNGKSSTISTDNFMMRAEFDNINKGLPKKEKLSLIKFEDAKGKQDKDKEMHNRETIEEDTPEFVFYSEIKSQREESFQDKQVESTEEVLKEDENAKIEEMSEIFFKEIKDENIEALDIPQEIEFPDVTEEEFAQVTQEAIQREIKIAENKKDLAIGDGVLYRYNSKVYEATVTNISSNGNITVTNINDGRDTIFKKGKMDNLLTAEEIQKNYKKANKLPSGSNISDEFREAAKKQIYEREPQNQVSETQEYVTIITPGTPGADDEIVNLEETAQEEKHGYESNLAEAYEYDAAYKIPNFETSRNSESRNDDEMTM